MAESPRVPTWFQLGRTSVYYLYCIIYIYIILNIILNTIFYYIYYIIIYYKYKYTYIYIYYIIWCIYNGVCIYIVYGFDDGGLNL